MQKSLQERKCWLSKTDSTRWSLTRCHTRESKSNLAVALTSWTTTKLKIKWPLLPSWRKKQMLGTACLPEHKKQLQRNKLSTTMQTIQTLSSHRQTSKADLADSTPTLQAKLPKNVLVQRQVLIKPVSLFNHHTIARKNLLLPCLLHITARSKRSHLYIQVRNKMRLHLSTVTRQEYHHLSGARSHQFQLPPTIAKLPQALNIRIRALSGQSDQVASRSLEQLLYLESLRRALVD